MATLSTAILCVDDDSKALTSRRHILSLASYNILTADSADTALRVFRHTCVDVVVTAGFLPGGTGAQLAGCLKKLDPDVSVVLLTSSPEAPSYSQHGDLVLKKDMAPSKFVAAIAQVVAGEPKLLA